MFFMSSGKRAAIAAAVIILVLALLALWFLFMRSSIPGYEPSVGVYQGVDVVAVEDFVSAEGGRYVVRATAPERFAQVPVWGGWSVSANITYSTLAVNLTDGGRGVILIFGVASKNATLDQDLGNNFRVHAHGGGGYVVYNNTAGWCLRIPVFQSGVYVWLPASTCSLNVQYRITVDPILGAVYVNGEAVPVYNVRLVKVQGVLPGWLVYANASGVYYFTSQP
jgi:hypothetical protein